MGKENLIPFTTEQSREEAKRNGSKGGVASGKARRAKKMMREWAQIIGSTPISMTLPDKTPIDGDLNAAVVLKMYQKAVKGDQKAAKFLADLRGEMVQQMEIKDVTPTVVVDNPETAEKLKKIINKE